jgi:tetratricopeptide (TPR) repeat protein
MNKAFLAILLMAFVSVRPVMATDSDREAGHAIPQKIEELINATATSNDYSLLTNMLKEMAKKKDLPEEDMKRLEDLLVKFSNKYYTNIDPATFSQIIAPTVDLFPNNFRLSVKFLKAIVERAKLQAAGQFVPRIFDIRKTKVIYDDEFEAVWLAVSGLEAMQISQYEMALDYYQKAIKKDPTWTGPYFLMAGTKLRQKKLDEASQLLDKALEMNPHHEGAAEFKKAIAGVK